MYLTGLPSLRASRKVNSSGVVCSLPPNPPHDVGAITRILDWDLR